MSGSTPTLRSRIPAKASGGSSASDVHPRDVLELTADHELAEIPERYGRNPFEPFRSGREQWNLVKWVLLFPLALVRTLIWIVMLLLLYLVALGVTLGQDTTTGEPFGPRRRQVMKTAVQWTARILLFVSGFYRISFTDLRDKSKPAPGIIVANHVSIFDTLPILWYLGCCAAAKKELFDLPVLGTLFRAMQCIPVDRYTPEGRQAALDEFRRRALDPRFPPLLVFPQGTTSTDRALTAFKRGAFESGVAVQPACLGYPNRWYDAYLSWRGMLHSMWWANSQFVNYVSFDLLEQFEPTPAMQENPSLFADQVRATMAAYMHVPVTKHSLADAQLMLRAMKRFKQDPTDIHSGMDRKWNFLVSDITQEYGFRSQQVIRLLELFYVLDKDGDGVLTLHEFQNSLRVRADKAARRLFKLFNTDASGNIGFGEFVVGVATCTTDVAPTDALRVLFLTMDSAGDGVVDASEFDFIANLLPKEVQNTDVDIGLIRRALFGDEPATADPVTLVEFLDRLREHGQDVEARRFLKQMVFSRIAGGEEL